MVACGSRYHTRAPAVLPENMNFVGGTADLKRAGGLQVLGLEEDLASECAG
jgi:hypothetical protein